MEIRGRCQPWPPKAHRGLLEGDILGQPSALSRLILDGPSRWDSVLRTIPRFSEAGGRPDRILVTGMGSSFFAATGAATSMRRWGVPAVAMLASDALHEDRRPGPRDLVIVVSESGESVEGVRLLRRLDGHVPSLAVTNNPGSPMASLSSWALPLGVAPDHGVAVKTFGASLLALLYLGTRLAGRGVDAWRTAAEETVSSSASVIERSGAWRELGRGLDPTTHAMVTLARGPAEAAAREAALLANEVGKAPAWFEEGGQFRHGIIELSGPRVLAALVVPEGRTADLQVSLARELARTGARVITTATARYAAALAASGAEVMEVPDSPEDYATVLHVLPYQQLALGWAEGRGLIPGRFRFVSGVIRSEGSEDFEMPRSRIRPK